MGKLAEVKEIGLGCLGIIILFGIFVPLSKVMMEGNGWVNIISLFAVSIIGNSGHDSVPNSGNFLDRWAYLAIYIYVYSYGFFLWL